MTGSHPDDDGDLDLPELGDEDSDEDSDEDVAPIDEGVLLPALGDDDHDPLDDSCADDLPIDVEIATDTVEPTVVGDDAEGMKSGTAEHEGVDIEEGGASLIDEGRGHAEEGLEFGGDDELGLDPIPSEIDDGGLEGLEEPDAHAHGSDFLPPLDGDEEDDDDEEEIDIGIEIGPPPVEPALEEEDDET